jgi:hypothetical protein
MHRIAACQAGSCPLWVKSGHAGYFDSRLTCCSTTTGSVNANVEPWPGCDSTHIRPPCISIMRFAVQLSGTEAGTIYTFDESHQQFRLRATYGMDDAIIAEIKDQYIQLGDTILGRTAARRMSIQIADVQEDPSAAHGMSHCWLRPRWRFRSYRRPFARIHRLKAEMQPRQRTLGAARLAQPDAQSRCGLIHGVLRYQRGWADCVRHPTGRR